MRRYESRESRFSARALLTYAAASLPETLSVVAATAESTAEILLYDEIGMWGTSANDFAQALVQAGEGPLTLRINSPGGDVFDGYAIYNMLRARSAPVSVVVDGVAASAASFIAMAGKTIAMGEPSMLMIHNCWGLCIGDRNDMLDTAAVQEKIDGQIAAIYAAKCGKPVTEMAAVMDAETWYTSTEAKDVGLCDSIVTKAAPAARAATPVKPKATATETVVADSSIAEADAAAAEAAAMKTAEALAEEEAAKATAAARANNQRRLRLAEAEAA